MTLGRVLILIVGLSGPASADSLADMRQDLADLLYATTRLRLELTATQVGDVPNDGALLDRTAPTAFLPLSAMQLKELPYWKCVFAQWNRAVR